MATLVVLNYNDFETTTRFLSLVKCYTCFEHIVVVDNCSTDDSYEKLRKDVEKHVVLIQTESNRGYAAGNNFGIQYAIRHFNPRYIIISNPDVKFSEKVVDDLIKGATNVARLGSITCVMQCTGSTKLPIAWRLPHYMDCLMENLILLKHFSHYNLGYPSDYFNRRIVEVDVVPGSFFLIDANAFMESGGFDEGTFLYYEENILAYRLKEHGYRNYLLTTQNYIHDHSVTINKSIASVGRRLKLSYAGRKYYCKKYLGIGRVKELLLDATFTIGLLDYQIANGIRNIYKRNCARVN